jgi:secreted frizzled-related protein 5
MAPASVLLVALVLSGVRGYFETWGLSGSRPTQPTCVDIPRNMSLCHGIGYNKMRLPNLLDHDTMAEVTHQASSWVALNNIRCHPDTQLFLCSLFSPVCLDRPIYPCRSLCEKVKQGCEGRMTMYGYPWPEMFSCTKFPPDNDMCIAPQSNYDPNSGEYFFILEVSSQCRIYLSAVSSRKQVTGIRSSAIANFESLGLQFVSYKKQLRTGHPLTFSH